MAQGVYEKLWDDHVVTTYDDGSALIFIDRLVVKDVSSPQAFARLAKAGRTVRPRVGGDGEWFYANMPAAMNELAESYDMDEAVVASAIKSKLALSPVGGIMASSR